MPTLLALPVIVVALVPQVALPDAHAVHTGGPHAVHRLALPVASTARVVTAVRKCGTNPSHEQELLDICKALEAQNVQALPFPELP